MLPKLTQLDDCGDYEAELAVVIGKTAKNVSVGEAINYVLGYTAANDVSSRTSQLNQSQWSFSKGFDGSCPLGNPAPSLANFNLIEDDTYYRASYCVHIRNFRPLEALASWAEER